MRLLVLHCRARQVPDTLLATGVLAVAAWLWANSQPDFGDAARALAVLAVSAALVTPGLAGPDVDLDRSMAVPWLRLRLAHVMGGAALCAAATLLALHGGSHSLLIIRDSLGLTGLYALGVAMLGGQLGWALPFPYLVASISLGAGTDAPGVSIWGWTTQSPNETSAWWIAFICLVLGSAPYLIRGAARRHGNRRTA
jgi:hypothetical protein